MRLRTTVGQPGSNFESDSPTVTSSRSMAEFGVEERPRSVNMQVSEESFRPTKADAARGKSVTSTLSLSFFAACSSMLRATAQGSSTPQSFRFLVLRFRLRSFRLCPITEANITGTAQNEISATHRLNHSLPNLVLTFLFHQYSMNLWQWKQAPRSRSNVSPSKAGPQQQHRLQSNRQGTHRWTGLCRSVGQSQRCE